MILEVAILEVKPSMVEEFETAFKSASIIIASMPGYISVVTDTQVQAFTSIANK
jgi:heme-degrading monooxygenase HmoA